MWKYLRHSFQLFFLSFSHFVLCHVRWAAIFDWQVDSPFDFNLDMISLWWNEHGQTVDMPKNRSLTSFLTFTLFVSGFFLPDHDFTNPNTQDWVLRKKIPFAMVFCEDISLIIYVIVNCLFLWENESKKYVKFLENGFKTSKSNLNFSIIEFRIQQL